MEKHCWMCRTSKPESDFNKQSSRCRECNRIYKREYRQRPHAILRQREHRRRYEAAHRKDAWLSMIERASKRLRFDHDCRPPQCQRCHGFATEKHCGDCIATLKRERKRRESQTPRARETRRIWLRQYNARLYRTQGRYRIRKLIAKSMRQYLKFGKSGESCWRVLPYTPVELESRLRSTLPDGYKWEDFLNGELHIDHIRPVASFDFEKMDDPDFLACYALSNLQLLPPAENMRKGDSWVPPRHDFLEKPLRELTDGAPKLVSA